HGDTPLEPGVVDSGGPSLIVERLIPPEFPILPSSLNLTFHGVGNNKTNMKGCIILPVFLPNAAVAEMSGLQAFFDCPWSSRLLKNLLQDTSSAEMSPVLTKPSLTRKLAILPSRYLDHPSIATLKSAM